MQKFNALKLKFALKFNDLSQSLLCDNHLENKFINRTICKVFSLTPKNLSVRREVVQQLKEKAKEATTLMIAIKHCLVLTECSNALHN